MKWVKRNIISIKEFSRAEIDYVLERSAVMEKLFASGKAYGLMNGRILATLFFEPSTRTRLSFSAAMERLGGSVIGFDEIAGTSVGKGESVVDTAKMAAAYADIIVMRNQLEGSARLVSEHVDVPVINGGDGANQHPTQTLLDLYTLKKEFGGIDGLNITLIGDLKYGRTVHSLAEALKQYKVSLKFISPKELRMPRRITKDLIEIGIDVKEASQLDVKDSDVLYVTRIQKERFPDPIEFEKVKDAFILDAENIKDLKKNAVILHPLPRVNEIHTSVDGTKHARYFEQARNGIPVRMALLCMVCGVKF
ncbi:MAG: aspartate carbamoyltransferase [Candidatus Altiarchaeota archaeon]